MANTYKIDNKRYRFVDIDSAIQTSYTVTEADHNAWIKIDTTTSSVNLTLPDGLSEGLRVIIENTGDQTINYLNGGGTSLATQQTPITEDENRSIEATFNSGEWRIQGFVGRNEISGLWDVNTTAGGPLTDKNVLEYNFTTGQWQAGANPPLTPRTAEALDFVLQDSDHGQIIPVETSAQNVDVAINTGLEPGLRCRIINIGTGSVTITPGVVWNSPITAITSQYGILDIFHAGSNIYYAATNDATGNPFIRARGALPADTGTGSLADQNFAIAIGNESEARAIDSIAVGNDATVGIGFQEGIAIGKGSRANAISGYAIGNGAQAGSQDSLAIGTTALTGALNAIQLGVGTNNVPNQLQFMNQPLASNSGGILLNSIAGVPTPSGQPDNSVIIDTVNKDLYLMIGGAFESKTRRYAATGVATSYAGTFAGSGEIIPFDTHAETEAGTYWLDTVGSPEELTIPFDGLYAIRYLLLWNVSTGSSGYRIAYLKNGLLATDNLDVDKDYNDSALSPAQMINSNTWIGPLTGGTKIYLAGLMFQSGAGDTKTIDEVRLQVEFIK